MPIGSQNFSEDGRLWWKLHFLRMSVKEKTGDLASLSFPNCVENLQVPFKSQRGKHEIGKLVVQHSQRCLIFRSRYLLSLFL